MIRSLHAALKGMVLLGFATCVAAGCTAYRAPEQTYPSGPAWPPEDPRIRLHSTIDLRGNLERGMLKALHRLGDEPSRAGFRRPYAVTWTGEDLIVVDPDARRVARISPQGRMSFAPDGLFTMPVGVAACSEGIVVTDSATGRAALLNENMRLDRWLVEDLVRPTGVACDEDSVYIVETGRHRIVKLDSGGKRVEFGERGDGAGRFNFPTSIALHDEELLVGDALNFRIQRFNADSGEYLGEFGQLGDARGEMPRIKGVAVDPEGRVWVTDGHLDSISLYDLDGHLLISIGETGSFPGEFSFPAGIAMHPDGRVVVADSLNRRLQILKIVDLSTRSGG